MGLYLFSRSSYDMPKKWQDEKFPVKQQVYTDLEVNQEKQLADLIQRARQNPNPEKFSVWKHLPVGDYLIVAIKYPDCTNYEGTKVLVYKDLTIQQLMAFRSVDPHFSENKKYKSPIARFVPTNEGWEMAMKFCLAMTN